MDRGAWWATVCGVSRESDVTWRLTFIYILKRREVKFGDIKKASQSDLSASW